MDFFSAGNNELFDSFNESTDKTKYTSNQSNKRPREETEKINTEPPSSEPSPKRYKTNTDPNVRDFKEHPAVIPIPVEPPVDERKVCQHEICVPPGWNNDNLYTPVTTDPVRKYPFTLDPFQKIATSCIDKGQSVLVSAHTSAGKTVVAEYAIARALRDRQRVIYTSPIKALSNQKYRELFEEFQDVGLMTGDITINPSASCLVMTTEILRSMLYRGSEILKEIGWVIFDEIHYMRDKERGVVWEETIILLPNTIRFVFLSATIPNAREFASWIAQIHDQPCNVVYTDYRPTPLQHYIFPAGGNGLFLVVDEKGNFREDNFQTALNSLVPVTEASKSKGKKGGKQTKGGSDCFKIVKMIMERNYEPVIVFAFSKKQCENAALQMSKLDFNNEKEKLLVETVFHNATDMLNEDDKKLPQIEQILPLLKRGIGIHHSGLLPLLKEVIEILFQEGLIKCLFATETFSMGLNMPAKTVVFSSVRKYDGKDFRWISGGEYIQMSGRAGRRGLDDRGIVILMLDEKMEPQVAQGMVKGQSDVLYSQFHIGYNMLLNLLRVEGMDPTFMLRHSFHQFQNDREIPQLRANLEKLEAERKQLFVPNEELITDYYQIRKQMDKLKKEVRTIVHQPLHAMPFLQQGRLVRVVDGDTNWGWGVVVNFQKRSNASSANKNTKNSDSNSSSGSNYQYIVDVLLPCDPSSVSSSSGPRPCPHGVTPDMQVIPVLLELLDGMSSVRIYIPKDLISAEKRQSVYLSLLEVFKRFQQQPGQTPNATGLAAVPLLDPVEDMKISDPTFTKVIRNIEDLEDNLNSSRFTSIPNLHASYQTFLQKKQLESQVKQIRKKLRETDNVILHDQLKAMKRVLRRLGFLTKDNVVDVKGRVAAEMNTSDELVITEMLFSGFFTDLNSEQIAAVMSCFVFEEKSNTNVKQKTELAGPLRSLQDIARRVAQVSKESKIDNVDVEEYIKKFKPDMMDVVFAWCQGKSFAEICTMTDIFEGSIIRSMRRLEELLRQLVSAAKAIGNTELEAKVAEAITKMKRDIVFAASLYL